MGVSLTLFVCSFPLTWLHYPFINIDIYVIYKHSLMVTRYSVFCCYPWETCSFSQEKWGNTGSEGERRALEGLRGVGKGKCSGCSVRENKLKV